MMIPTPSFADAFETLCLQAGDKGRADVLFGPCLERARKQARPFIVGPKFPSVYLEFPLVGDPFMDVTTLYSVLEPGTRVESEAADGAQGMLDWFADACEGIENVCCGFEVDVKDEGMPRAAVHFQPRVHQELVEPFCTSIGEADRARLYLDLAKRMPEDWPLSFFGLFRGRPESPLRVCGYIGGDEVEACAKDPQRIAGVFEQVGFEAYDDTMVARIGALMAAAPTTVDFQFDVYDDGHLGDTFAIDVEFGIEQPEAVRASFADGPAARVLGMLEGWEAADDRWKLGGDAAFARSVDVALEDGGVGRFGFTLMPQWAKARWTAGVLQPGKLYHYASAGLL